MRTPIDSENPVVRNVSSRSDGLTPPVLYRPSVCRHRARCSLTIGAGRPLTDKTMNSIHSLSLTRRPPASIHGLRAGVNDTTRQADALTTLPTVKGYPPPVSAPPHLSLASAAPGVPILAVARLECFHAIFSRFSNKFTIRQVIQAVRARLPSVMVARSRLEQHARGGSVGP